MLFLPACIPSKVALTCTGMLFLLKAVREPEGAQICLDPGMSTCTWPLAEALFGL